MYDKNYYELLGVSENASFEEIKKAYRKEIIFWHPDKNSSSESENVTKLLIEAYDTLKDVSKRDEYDRYNNLGKYAINNTHADTRTDSYSSVNKEQSHRRRPSAERRYAYTPKKEHTYSRHHAAAKGMSVGTPSWAKWATFGAMLLLILSYFTVHPIISIILAIGALIFWPVSLAIATMLYGFVYVIFMVGYQFYRGIYPAINRII